MTEFQLQPPHISVKARAREINARTEATPDSSPSLCMRWDGLSQNDLRSHAAVSRGGGGHQRPPPSPPYWHPSQDQPPTTSRQLAARGAHRGGGGGSSGESVPKIEGLGSEDEQSYKYGGRERSPAGLGKQVSVFHTFLGDPSDPHPAETTGHRAWTSPRRGTDVNDLTFYREEEEEEKDADGAHSHPGGRVGRRRDRIQLGDTPATPTYLVTCTLQINNSSRDESDSRTSAEDRTQRHVDSTCVENSSTELGLKGAQKLPECEVSNFTSASAGNSASIFSERAALDKSSGHSTKADRHSPSPLDEILCTLERICDEFSWPGWAGDATTPPAATSIAECPSSGVNVSSNSTTGGSESSFLPSTSSTSPVAVLSKCPDGELSGCELQQERRTGADPTEASLPAGGDGNNGGGSDTQAMNGSLGITPAVDNRELKPSVSTSVLLPTLLVTTLTKFPSSTSPISPAVCQSLKSQVRTKPDLPAYLTLGRRGVTKKISDQQQCKVDDSTNDAEKVRSILASLDFSKYRRGRSAKARDRGDQAPLSEGEDGAMDKSPKPPRSPMSKSGPKLKDLTDRLKPQSTSTAPASPNLGLPSEGRSATMSVAPSAISRKPYLVTRSSSFSQVELSAERGPNREDSSHIRSGISTLPRRKSPRLSTATPCSKEESGTTTTNHSGSMTPGLEETLKTGIVAKADVSVNSAATDEGMGSDSDSMPCYVNAYCSITSPSYQTKPLHQTQMMTGLGVNSVRQTADNNSKGSAPSSPDKRKRRKGIGAPSVEFQTGTHEHAKSSNGRSLTYPPQRKSSISEEELDFTSVDSNGLRSLNMSPGLAHDALRQPSDLSLADSHLCPSEVAAEESYQDVVDSINNGDMQRLNVEDRANKALKKKHHSDPGGDKASGESVDFPELIAASRSEPDLCEQPSDAPVTSSDNTGGSQQDVEGLRLGLKEAVDSPHVAGVHSRHVRMASDSLTPSPLIQSRFFGSEAGDLSERVTFGKSPQEQRRYSKKRLRGPYGEMLEEEMRKSGEKQKPSVCDDLSFLQQLCDKRQQQTAPTPVGGGGTSIVSLPEPAPRFASSHSLDDSALKTATSDTTPPKRKISANYPLATSESVSSQQESPLTGGPLVPVTAPHDQPQDTVSRSADVWGTNTQSDIKEGEDSDCAQNEWTRRHQDTRTHVVGELYDTEKSYVESLQILANKYMRPLKSPEHSGVVDAALVDEIFYQIPEILNHHEAFLEVLRQRLSNWDSKQKVGDVFVDAFTKQTVIDTYTAFINNWKSAKEAIKLASQAKPAFAKFLEHMSREHKGKLTLDALLIMPVQRIPRYELLIKELLKHTHVDHPDHQLLVLAQKEVHDLAVKINRVEREAFQHEQMQQRVKEIEQLIEGVMDLVQPDRTFIRYDPVSIPGGLGTKKERCLFLFSDLLLITSIKRKSGTIRKASSSVSSPSVIGPLEMNKYKLLMRFSLDNLDITKSSDGNVRKLLKEIENLEEDMSLLGQITELASNLNFQHQALDEAVRELIGNISKQLSEKQNADAQLLSLELTVTTQEGVDSLTIIFQTPEKRSAWELAFNEAKQKLALSTDRRPPPEFMYPLPIRKTRAGLQFTCAAATLGLNQFGMRDVWVCNSDGYVGQVCVLSLQPEPTVTSCNGVCNARILAIASIPAASPIYQPVGRRCSVVAENVTGVNVDVEETEDEDDPCTNNGNIQLDSDSSDDDEDDDDDDDETDSLEDEPQKQCSLPRDDSREDMDHHQPTMWLGTEDGCIHIYNCSDNIRIKKNKVKIQHPAAIYYIIYLDNRVFVSLANGELHIYRKDLGGGWNASDPQKAYVGTTSSPVTRILTVAGKLWCGCQNSIRVLNVGSLLVEHTFQASSDPSRSVLCMVTSGLGVWIAIQHSAVLRLFHATSYECLLDVNVAPAVTKMLAGCDDIIRQHKAACLRVTSLLTCKDLLWIGTSAGVVLTLPLPHLTSTTTKLDTVPNVSGIPHGHTGHVRFLTSVEMSSLEPSGTSKYGHRSLRGKEGMASRRSSTTVASGCKLLVISGGDGYEDFRTTGLSEAAGRDDSTNHLLLWQV